MRQHHNYRPTLLDRALYWFHADERRQARFGMAIIVGAWLLGQLIVGDEPPR